MAVRDSGKVEWRARPNSDRRRKHAKRSGREAVKGRVGEGERCDRQEEPDVLGDLSRAIALVETIAIAMHTHAHDRELGSIVVTLDFACIKLLRAHEAVDHALTLETA